MPYADDVLKVVAVDDHETIRAHVAAWVSKTGVAEVVAVFATSREALEYCGANDVDLVLCDYHMPYMNGPGLAEALRCAGIDAPVLLFSAHVIKDDSVPVLPKTATVAQLRDALLSAVGVSDGTPGGIPRSGSR